MPLVTQSRISMPSNLISWDLLLSVHRLDTYFVFVHCVGAGLWLRQPQCAQVQCLRRADLLNRVHWSWGGSLPPETFLLLGELLSNTLSFVQKYPFKSFFLFSIVNLKLCYSNLMKQCPISSGVRNSDSELHTGQCFDTKYKQGYQLTSSKDNAQ